MLTELTIHKASRISIQKTELLQQRSLPERSLGSQKKFKKKRGGGGGGRARKKGTKFTLSQTISATSPPKRNQVCHILIPPGWKPQGEGRGGEHYLPAAVAEQQQRQGDGGARHGVGGGHAVLGVVEDFQLHHGRGGRPRPADDILGALPQVHHPHPDDDQPPAQPGVQIPDAEGEEEDVEELVAQLRAQAEEIVEEPAAGGELLAAVLLREGVAAWPPPPPLWGARPAGHGPVPGGMPRGRGAAVNHRPRGPGSLLCLGPARRPLHPTEPLEGGHLPRVLQVGGQEGQAPAKSHGERTKRPARGGLRAARRCPGRRAGSRGGFA